jgi:paraquat-inducible protein B
MSKPANKTVIGVFVVIAVVLGVAALVIFGSGKFFTKVNRYVIYFQGSVKGLRTGAPVVFRGVQIGEVTDVIIQVNTADLKFQIPVHIQIDPSNVSDIGPERKVNPEEFLFELINKGLRAQLQLQSLVTGLLMINLDFHPDTPIELISEKVGLPKDIVGEIPTIPTPFEKLEKTFEQIPISDIAEDVRSALKGIEKVVNSPELTGSIEALEETLRSIQLLAQNIDKRVGPLSTSIEEAFVEAKAGISDARTVMKNIDTRTVPLVARLKKAAESAQVALDQANNALKGIENLAAEGTQLRYEISVTMREISGAARSVRVLTDYLEQHPDALIRGKVSRTGGN